MRRLGFSLWFSLSVASLTASGDEIYRWIDANGEAHYTNDASTIPPALRKKAKVTQGAELLVVETSKEEPPKAAAKALPGGSAKSAEETAPTKPQTAGLPSVPVTPRPATPSVSPPDDGGEARWRGLFRAAHEEIARRAKEAEADRAKLSNPEGGGVGVSYNARGAAVPNPELDRVREHLARTEQALEDAQRHLDDLERQASREAVPREWRR